MIPSILFSFKEEHDHKRRKEAAAGVTFVTLFVLKLSQERQGRNRPRKELAEQSHGCGWSCRTSLFHAELGANL
jgi:hypothetical protein